MQVLKKHKECLSASARPILGTKEPDFVEDCILKIPKVQYLAILQAQSSNHNFSASAPRVRPLNVSPVVLLPMAWFIWDPVNSGKPLRF